MTPPAAATAAARHGTRVGAPARPSRRPSGPARARSGSSARARSGSPAGAAAVAPLGLRLLRGIAALPDARLVDRVARGRLWIALLGAALVGIVFLQISLLQLNTGISRAVQSAQTLGRRNTALKLDLSRLAGGEHVEDSAAARGFIVPATGQPRFLDARRASAARAAAAITAPDPVTQLPLGMISPSQGGTAGLALPAAPVATSAPAAGTPGALAAATTTPATPASSPQGAATPAAAPASPVTPTSAAGSAAPAAAASAGAAGIAAAPAATPAAPASATAAPGGAATSAGGASVGSGG